MATTKWVVFYCLFVQAKVFLSEKQGIFERQTGYRITQGVFHCVTSHTVMDCVEECTKNILCKSLNYHIKDKKCYLSNKNKRLVMVNDLTADPGYVYYEKDLCYPSPCVFATGCAMDNSELGFKCFCLSGYKGNQCEKKIVGLKRESPGMSCKHILDNGDAAHGDGKYWIDPDKSNNPMLVHCDMTHDQGGWLLTSNVVLPTPVSKPSLTLSTSYRDIANYNINITVLSATALGQLYQLMQFTQIRFHCYMLTVNRVLHLITTKKDVVDYFTAVSNVRPASCNSFQRGEGDTSMLAGVCSQWSYTGLWGSGSRINEWRMHDHTFYVALKHHWITYGGRFECDSKDSILSAGNFWKIYVR